VGGGLSIAGNDALTNLNGLGALTSLGPTASLYSLYISSNPALTNLDGLSTLTSLDKGLGITSNDALADLDGLGGITSVGNDFIVYFNDILPDCEVCDLLDQLTSVPTTMTVSANLDDTCTPVPANCP
jgi:hypothetical protein